MSSYSANDIIEKAAVKARVTAPGESLPAAKASAIYEALNDLLEAWTLDNLTILYDTVESQAMVSGQAEYTWGSGGDWTSDRPLELRDETFVRQGNVDYPIRFRPLEHYRRKHTKSTGARPRIISYDPEYPLGRVYLWPTPVTNNSIYIRSLKQVTEFTDRTTSVALPPGYARAIISNLAVEICPDFGKKIPKALAYIADKSLKAVKSQNTKPRAIQRPEELAAMTRTGRGYLLDIQSGPFY